MPDAQEQMNEIRKKALTIERKLFSDVPISIVCLRRKTFKKFPSVQLENKTYFVLDNISQISYFLLYDIFKNMSYQVFCGYKHFILTSDLSWINKNPSTPRSFKFLTEDIFKRFIVDYYVLVEKYSTREVLEIYDLDFIFDVYQRAVMLTKGSKSSHLTNFRKAIPLDDWIEHHERTCGIKGKIDVKGNALSELMLDMHGYLVSIKILRDKFLVEREN